MNTYLLLDGALVNDPLRASPLFAKPGELFQPLMPHPDQHLAGALLIAKDHLSGDKKVGDQLQPLLDGFCHRMHVSMLSSDLTLSALADHLRRAVWFTDDSGDSYGLRIADGRVMAYLPDVLTPAQWQALTAPIHRWVIHDRSGRARPLALDEARAAHGEPFEGLHLTAAQIDRLIEEGEPDALLQRLGWHAGRFFDPDHAQDFATATACVRHWRAAGHTDRAVLMALARAVFFSAERGRYRDAEWMDRLLHNCAGRA